MSELSDLLQRLNTERWSSRRIESEASKHGHQLSNATAAKYLRGDHPDRPNHATLQAFADVFSVPASRLRTAVGLPGLSEPFDLGPESARLTGDQRAAIRHVVRVMLEQNDALARDARPDGATTRTSPRPLRLLSDDAPEGLEDMPYAANEDRPGDDPGEDND